MQMLPDLLSLTQILFSPLWVMYVHMYIRMLMTSIYLFSELMIMGKGYQWGVWFQTQHMLIQFFRAIKQWSHSGSRHMMLNSTTMHGKRCLEKVVLGKSWGLGMWIALGKGHQHIYMTPVVRLICSNRYWSKKAWLWSVIPVSVSSTWRWWQFCTCFVFQL
jgi:hypothetical protein